MYLGSNRAGKLYISDDHGEHGPKDGIPLVLFSIAVGCLQRTDTNGCSHKVIQEDGKGREVVDSLHQTLDRSN
jgi:hypothetical protein